MGMCDQGPAMLVNDEIYTQLNPAKVRTIVEDYRPRPRPHGDPASRSVRDDRRHKHRDPGQQA